MFAPEPYFPDYPDDVQGQQTKTEEPSNILVPDEQDASWKGTLFTLPYKQAKEYEVKHYPDGTIMPMTYEEWSRNVKGYTGKDGILPDNALADGYKGRGYTLGQAYDAYRNKVSADNAAYLKRKHPATIEEKRRALGLNPYWKGNDYTNSLFTTFGAPLAGAMLLPAASAFAGTGVASAVGNGAVQAFNWAMPKVTLPYLGGKVVDEGSKLATGKSWAENVRDGLVSWGVPEDWAQATGDLSNPAYIAPYGKMAESIVAPTKKGLDKAFDFFFSPLTGKWTQFGNREYRFNPNQVGINGILPENRPVLSEGMKNAGWTVNESGYAINSKYPNKRLVYKNGWQSEATLNERNKIEAMRAREAAKQKAKQKELKNIVSKFEKEGITGFSTKEWKAMRRGFTTTKDDIMEYESHLPEYSKLFEELSNNGQLKKTAEGWVGMVNNRMMPVNPRQYIIAHSSNFQNNGWAYDGFNRGNAIRLKHANKLATEGGIDFPNWTSTDNAQLSEFARERDFGPVLRGVVGKRNVPDRTIPNEKAYEEANSFLKGISDVQGPVLYPYRTPGGTYGNWRIFGPDERIKAIDGNTGEFSNKKYHPLSSFIPFVSGASTIGLLGNSIQEQ